MIGGELRFVTAPAGTIDTEITGFLPALHVDYETKVSIGTNHVQDWGASGLSVLRVGTHASLAGTTAQAGGSSLLLSNAFYSNAGTDTYNFSDEASQYEQKNGIHTFRVAIAGTVGNPITWKKTFTLDNNYNAYFGEMAFVTGSEGVLHLSNATTAPATSPVGGGLLFTLAGALRYRGTSGAAVTVVNADGTLPGGGSIWSTTGSDIYYNSGGVSINNATAMDWDTAFYNALRLGTFTNLINSSGVTYMTQNAYYNAGWKFQGANKSARMQLTNGNTVFAVSSNTGVSAGDAITSWVESIYITNAAEVQVRSGVLKIKELAAAAADTAAYGQIWVKNDAPNTLWFTDDTGTDIQLGVSTLWTESGSDIYFSGGNVSVGGASNTRGLLDVYAGNAGTLTANADSDDFIIESSGHGGMSILVPDASNAEITMGSPTKARGAIAKWDPSIARLTYGTNLAAGHIYFTTGLFNIGAMFLESDGQVKIAQGWLKIKETAAAAADTTAYGQLWVKNDVPNTLYFTDDNGVDHQISGKEDVFVTNSNGNANISDIAFSISGAVAEATWEEVGPTGATNVWSPLNSIPTDVDWIEVRAYVFIDGGTASTDTYANINVRNDGGTQANGVDNAAGGCQFYADSAGNGRDISAMTMKIPVTARKFEVRWNDSPLSTPTTFTAELHLVGYGYNK